MAESTVVGADRELIEQFLQLGQRHALGNEANPEAFDASIAELAAGAAVIEIVAGYLVRMTRSLWENGWQPLDAVHVVRRRFGARTAGLAESAILDEAASAGASMHAPADWSDQLTQLDPAPPLRSDLAGHVGLGDAVRSQRPALNGWTG